MEIKFSEKIFLNDRNISYFYKINDRIFVFKTNGSSLAILLIETDDDFTKFLYKNENIIGDILNVEFNKIEKERKIEVIISEDCLEYQDGVNKTIISIDQLIK
jgi:hypothetical protein